jgi:hypothetical protein
MFPDDLVEQNREHYDGEQDKGDSGVSIGFHNGLRVPQTRQSANGSMSTQRAIYPPNDCPAIFDFLYLDLLAVR